MPLTLFDNTNEMIRSFKGKENIHNKKHLLKRKLSMMNICGRIGLELGPKIIGPRFGII